MHGKSRSATCVAFYLMRKAGMSLDDALCLMKGKRGDVDPIPAFVKQLRDYEVKCQKKAKGSQRQKRKRSSVADQSTMIGPSIGPTQKRAIGPSLPRPGIQKKDKISSGNAPTGPSKEGSEEDKHIGPSFPKTSGYAVSQDQNKIGPELPDTST
mmetsp:Transcript_37766/g.53273  ORF Transcript_37766/g.53273 Transcript_37766/m.53273 type:complete len:154 (-) Transcript_37766:53-514(-)